MRNRGSIPVKKKDIFSFISVQTDSGPPSLLLKRARRFSLRGKRQGRHLNLVPRLRTSKVINPTPPCTSFTPNIAAALIYSPLSDCNNCKIITIKIKYSIKTVKVKANNVHSIICHEGRKGKYRESSLSLTSAQRGGAWSTLDLGRFTLGNEPVRIV